MKLKMLMLVLIFYFPLMSFFDYSQVTKTDLLEFLELYKKRPIADNSGGMKSIGCFWVWYVTKKLNEFQQIDLIVESGVWYGQSTWLLEQAAPHAKIISIDPKLDRLHYRSPRIFYTTEDFSTIDFGDITNFTTLCFFDDHINAYARLMQAYEKGFKYLIFDDNYPAEWGSEHYTLARCYSQNNFLTKQIDNIIQKYKVLPHICTSRYKKGSQMFNFECLNIPLIEPAFNTFKQDAHTYRWTTCVTLKNQEN